MDAASNGWPSPYFTTFADVETTAAWRHAHMSRSACEAELKARNVPFKRESARGVLAPVRLTGPVNGVLFRGEGTDRERATSLHEIIDCRLVLSLYDAAEILREHDIVEVRHFSIYRLPPSSWPRSKPAARHMGGVAFDAGRFIKKDGSVLDVLRHFYGAIDAKTCGPRAKPRRPTPEALELRALLCKLVAARLFTVVLTPNFNAEHRNHFHLEIAVWKKWFLLH